MKWSYQDRLDEDYHNLIAGLIRKQVKARIESKGPYPRSSINTKICIRWGISDVVFKSKDLIGNAEFWLALYYLLVN